MIKQFEKKQFKQLENQSQSGRSMIEMLGVLAIIAILSIGGIVGYKLAMNYYQADQIANEINLMRNDLKVKYALGNEELLLGDPYDDTPADENYSGHLSTQYDRYPVDYDCIRKDKAEFYNCRETDAYYIKVGNVSKGVCKPLTTLLNGMDSLMYMEINKQPYKEDDLCSSDENNEIYIEFDAEEVNGNYDSNRPDGWCADDEDCEEPQVCDKENNTCVECTENTHCASNICRGDHTCGECTSDSDCLNPRPICDEETATCVGCAVDDECPDTNKPNCDTESGACCDDPLMTWNGSECVCPEDQPWNGKSCGCRTNDDCKSDEFCVSRWCEDTMCDDNNNNDNDLYHAGILTEEESCKEATYKCIKISEYTAPNLDSSSSSYIMSNQGMNWWSAERFCERYHKNMLKISDLDCCESLGGTEENYCSAKGDICSSTNGATHVIKALRKAETGSEDQGINWYWLEDPYTTANKGRNSCAVYVVRLTHGDSSFVHSNNRSNHHVDNDEKGERYALCQ